MASNNLVHVIDDDYAVCDSLGVLFASAGLDVKTYDSARAFLKRSQTNGRGCVVTDVKMPEMSGLELLRELASSPLRLPVIVLTGQADVPMAVEALKNGAADFIEKPFRDDLILAAVQAALGRLDDEDGEAARSAEFGRRIAGLSAREREVLDGLVDGQSNKMIGLELGISSRTVEVYRANIMTKMMATSLSELVRMTLLARG
jgi:two-component system response regulator FixJ